MSEHKNPRHRTFPIKITPKNETPLPKTNVSPYTPVPITQLRLTPPQRYFPLKVKTIMEPSVFNVEKSIIPETPHEPQKRAILIGISYFNTDHELKGSRDDIYSMYAFLISAGYHDILILTDDIKDVNFNDSCCPTKGRILSKLSEFVTKTKSSDTLFIHYSGRVGEGNNLIRSIDNFITYEELNDILIKPFPDGARLRVIMDGNFNQKILDLSISKDVILIHGYLDKKIDESILINGRFHGAITWAFMVSMQKLSIFDGVFQKWDWKDLFYQMRFQLISNGFNQMPKIFSTDEKYLLDKIKY